MSKLMSLKGLKNNPHRSGFDLGHKNCFTAKVGELLPIECLEVLPGDKFKISPEWFTRTMPVNTAAYTRIKEYFDFFFVPTRLLWRWFPNFITQMDNEQSALDYAVSPSPSTIGKKQPFLSVASLNSLRDELKSNGEYDICGQLKYKQTDKLLSYLDYPVVDDIPSANTPPLNMFPLLAYQKVYYDYFRFNQWESADPRSWNVDYINGIDDSSANLYTPFSSMISQSSISNPFELRYANWKKDFFMGLLPQPQFGDSAQVNLGSFYYSNYYVPSSFGANKSGNIFKAAGSTSLLVGDESSNATVANVSSLPTFSISHSGNSINLSVLALRQAQALQKWKEISLSGNEDYKSQIEKHFGVKVSDTLSGMCKFLGGTSGMLDIGEVINTNLSSEGNEANIMGKGVGAGKGYIDFEAHEHGYLLCIYHAIPLLDYNNVGLPRMLTKTEPTDYAIPEFDSLGMEAVRTNQLVFRIKTSSGSSIINGDNILGYGPRYLEYKTQVDRVHGAFTSNLPQWVAPLDNDWFVSHLSTNSFQTQNQITIKDYSFFKVTPSVLDSIFATNAAYEGGGMDTDNLLVNCHLGISSVRNLSYEGMPY